MQTCERERRQREHEAKMERQRQIEADRNKKALDRALAKPFVKVGNKNSKFSVVKIIISVLWGEMFDAFLLSTKNTLTRA